MKRLTLLCLCLAGFGPFTCNQSDVEEARRKTEAGEAGGALTALEQVTEDAAEVHLARAVAQLHAKKTDEAIESLSNAYRVVASAEARGEPPLNAADLRKRIAFNRGLAQIQKEAWQDAVTEFGKALLLDPDDDDARYNLEMAWLKAHPPCAMREDDHEQDDTRKDAKPLDKPAAAGQPGQPPAPPGQPGEGPPERLLCPADEDWYAIEAPARSLLYVTLKGEVVAEEDQTLAVTLDLFAPQDADIAPSRTAEFKDGQARVSYTDLPEGGQWAVRVAGIGKAELKYHIEVELVPPCPADDNFEGQDTADNPKALAEGEEPTLKACPGNDDWFLVKVPAKEGRRVTVGFDGVRAPLDVELYDAERALVTRAPIGPNGGALHLPPAETEGTWRVRVAAASAEENIYKIKVEKDEGDPNPDQDKQDKDDQKDQDDQDPDKKDQPSKPPPPPDEVDIDQLIDALDQHERNPQLEKALRQLKVAPPPMEDY